MRGPAPPHATVERVAAMCEHAFPLDSGRDSSAPPVGAMSSDRVPLRASAGRCLVESTAPGVTLRVVYSDSEAAVERPDAECWIGREGAIST